MISPPPAKEANIFIERLWRSLKYEEVYLHAYEAVADAKAGIGQWMRFYNEERPHQALAYATPAAVYGLPKAVDMVDIATAMTTCPPPTSTAGFQLV